MVLLSVIGSCQSSQEPLSNHFSAVNILVFMGTECPISQQYSLTLENIKQAYHSADSLTFIALFPKNISQREAAAFLNNYSMTFRPWVDTDLTWARRLKATVTPEVFIVSKDLNILYQGAIDNWYKTLGENRQVVNEHYLKENLHALLQGKKPPFRKTKAVGCFIEL